MDIVLFVDSISRFDLKFRPTVHVFIQVATTIMVSDKMIHVLAAIKLYGQGFLPSNGGSDPTSGCVCAHVHPEEPGQRELSGKT